MNCPCRKTAELDFDLVKESREESKPLPIPSEAVLVISEAAPPAPALEEVSSVEETSLGPEGVQAMSWALKTDDEWLIRSVCDTFI